MAKTETIYGVHAVTAIVKSHPMQIKMLYVSHSARKRLKEIIALAEKSSVTLEFVSNKIISEKLPEKAVHQGVLAVCRRSDSTFGVSDIERLVGGVSNPVILILDQIQDPHNLGACLRSANAMGACCVIIPKDRSVGLTATVNKVACGATVTMPLIQVTNLARVLKLLQQLGIWLVGLDASSDTVLQAIDLTGPIALVMGSEGQGMRSLTKKHCDYLAKINMMGSVSSLNVSVATGMTLYEVQRQRLNV